MKLYQLIFVLGLVFLAYTIGVEKQEPSLPLNCPIVNATQETVVFGGGGGGGSCPSCPICPPIIHELNNESPLYFADYGNYSFILALEDEDLICVSPAVSNNATVCNTSMETFEKVLPECHRLCGRHKTIKGG